MILAYTSRLGAGGRVLAKEPVDERWQGGVRVVGGADMFKRCGIEKVAELTNTDTDSSSIWLVVRVSLRSSYP